MSRRLVMIGNASGPMGSFVAGSVYAAPGDLPEAMAAAFVAAGAARWLEVDKPAPAPVAVETATAAATVETAAAAPAPKKRGRSGKAKR